LAEAIENQWESSRIADSPPSQAAPDLPTCSHSLSIDPEPQHWHLWVVDELSQNRWQPVEKVFTKLISREGGTTCSSLRNSPNQQKKRPFSKKE